MKFSEFRYERPEMKNTQEKFHQLLDSFKNAESVEKQIDIIGEINVIRKDYESMSSIASIRYDINTTDSYCQQEKDFFDENGPLFDQMTSDFSKALIESNFRKELEDKYGKQVFNLSEVNIKTFSPEIIEDLQQENKLISEYKKLLASAKIMFEGQERNLSQMRAFMQSKDRNTRKRAAEERYGFLAENEDKLDDIYDKLVKVRNVIAKKLGYKSFTQLGYDRLGRTDYNAEMVAFYRTQIEKYIVPMAARLKERQRKRLGLEELEYYDDDFMFNTGNPKPVGTPEEIVESAQRMYSELSKETGEFFRMMREDELLDLVSKKGKSGGGYTSYIPNYNAPFIFSNFNGTSGDVDVLTHEAGHAFQVYTSKDNLLPEYLFPTLEACEIHSMSMEFLTYPWMELFFGEQADKYRFMHLGDAITFLPYGVAVDEFQHFVYENPEATPKERKQAWRNIEKKYLPWSDYKGNKYLEGGAYWHQQGHIFEVPFYYIDYTLAQVCAFQMWKRMAEDKEKTWRDYMRICAIGGSLPFLKILEAGELESPFVDSCLAGVSDKISSYLESIDDSRM
jgi:M3 family oligoendopeptidase